MRPRAFTLVETLAACALSALFLLAAFKIVAALARDKQSVHFPPPPSALPALLRADLQAATGVTFAGSTLTLTGPLALAPHTHLPAQITYAIEQIESRPWLIRTQQLLKTPPTPATRELLLPNILLFQPTPLRDPNEDKDKPPPIPKQVLLTIQTPSETTQTTLTLR